MEIINLAEIIGRMNILFQHIIFNHAIPSLNALFILFSLQQPIISHESIYLHSENADYWNSLQRLYISWGGKSRTFLTRTSVILSMNFVNDIRKWPDKW